jgi:hypothetical protein
MFLADDLLAGHGLLWVLLIALALLGIAYLIRRF